MKDWQKRVKPPSYSLTTSEHLQFLSERNSKKLNTVNKLAQGNVSSKKKLLSSVRNKIITKHGKFECLHYQSTNRNKEERLVYEKIVCV